jgi:putative DNA primase/helicase
MARPVTPVTSETTSGSLTFIRTATTFLGKEDPKLEGKLLAELPGIVRWALGGLADLHELGSLTQPSSAKEDIRSMRDMAAPVGAFLGDRCKLDPQAQTETGDLFDAYLDWCRSEGHKYTTTKEQFGRDLRAVKAINRKQRRCKLTGKAKPVYVGVRLLPA